MDRYLHENQANNRLARVFFTGSTAIKRGEGFCYDRNYTDSDAADGDRDATDGWGGRGVIVTTPSSSDNLTFAGVAAHNYKAKTGGQWIDIYLPGSICEIAVGFAATIATTRLTCSASSADAGRFTFQGHEGRGTAIALETLALADGGDIAEKSVDGTATGSLSGSTYTISLTGIGTACGYGDDDIDPTDFTCVVLGGADDSTGGDASNGEMATAGEYDVLTAPTADTITIDGDPGDCDLLLYIIKGNPTILAYLEDGQESGLQEVISPQDAVAVSSMVGGTTYVAGGWTMAADSTFTLADGTIEGLRKTFTCLGTLTTKDYKVTVTSGIQSDGSTSLASFSFDGAGDLMVLEWAGSMVTSGSGLWRELISVAANKA